jgi:hypothetical protein
MNNAVFATCRGELKAALMAWDFRDVFPDAYAGPKQVTVESRWPYDTIDNMLREDPNLGAMTMPVISLIAAHGTPTFRSFNQAFYDRTTGTMRHASRQGIAILVSVWADQLLGGYEMVEKLAGEVCMCVQANEVALPSYRHLRWQTSEAAYEDRPQLYTYDVHVEGDTLIVYDRVDPALYTP